MQESGIYQAEVETPAWARAASDPVHKSDHPSDVERGKIQHETQASVRDHRDIELACSRLIGDPVDDSLAEKQAVSEHHAKKEMRNARGHKRRLKHLEELGLE